jgi:tetratricopeptide (TPR) repeat protein
MSTIQSTYTKLVIALLLTTLPLLFTSCDKYLGVEPKGKRLLKTVNDYDQWLNSYSVIQVIPNEMLQLDDNVDAPRITIPFSGNDNWVYAFQKQFTVDPATPPIIWKDFYESVYYYNTVLLGIEEATGGTDEQKKSLKAEALLGRAFCYLYLVNLYGPLYDAATADKDLAVPFVTSNDLNAPTPDRNTVKNIYDHILEDCNEALANLPKDNSQNRFRGTVAGAYSVLARTYLYMRDFEQAGKNARLALDNSQTTILDYGALAGVGSMSPLPVRAGAIYAKLPRTTYTQLPPTLGFLKSFHTKDLRLAFYYTNLGDYSFQKRGDVIFMGIGVQYSGAYPNCGTSVEEMRLILAEIAARANDLPMALDQLDQVRKNRFKPADYQKFVSNVQEEVLNRILKERTFEFAFNGLRWFDMRRLDAENRMPEIKRYDGQDKVIASLPPHSDKYTLQIPLQVMYFHPDWPQNPWSE